MSGLQFAFIVCGRLWKFRCAFKGESTGWNRTSSQHRSTVNTDGLWCFVARVPSGRGHGNVLTAPFLRLFHESQLNSQSWSHRLSRRLVLSTSRRQSAKIKQREPVEVRFGRSSRPLSNQTRLQQTKSLVPHVKTLQLGRTSTVSFFQLAVQYFIGRKVAVVQLCDSFVGVRAKRVSSCRRCCAPLQLLVCVCPCISVVFVVFVTFTLTSRHLYMFGFLFCFLMGEAREEGSVCEDGSTWPFWALCSHSSETRHSEKEKPWTKLMKGLHCYASSCYFIF